jgi:YVTN family beta-propeller protein
VPSNDKGTVSVIDTSTNTVTATISFGAGKSNLMAASPVSERVYVTDILYGVRVLDSTTNTQVAVITVDGSARGVAVHPRTGQVYVTNYFGSGEVGNVYAIDPATNTVTRQYPAGIEPSNVVVNPQNGKLYVLNSSSNSVAVVEL